MRRLLAGILIAPALALGTAGIAMARGVRGPEPRGVAIAPQSPFTQVGTLIVPRLKLRTPIYLGIADAIFDVGVGQWPGTARPGRKGNLVIGGHRTGGMMPFLNIDKMRKGDKIKVVVRGKTFTYTVTSTSIIKPTNLAITRQTSNPTLTLFSCHPPHSIKLRYVVRASLTS